MPPVDFNDDPDKPPSAAAASGVPTPAGVPRIAVTPGARAPVTFDDDPDVPASTGRARPGDRTRELIAEQSKMGWPAWLTQGAGDFAASTADMASFGMRPRLDALTGSDSYDVGLAKELEQNRIRSERSPIATMGGNIAGGIAGGVAGGATKLGANIAGRALPYLPASVAKALGFGTEAGLVGGGQAAGHTYSGQVDDYLKAAKEGFTGGAIVGGALGPLPPTSAVRMRPGDPRTGQPIRPPTEAQQQAIVDRGYDIFRSLPATYSNRGFQAHLAAAERDMMNAGATRATALPAYQVLRDLRRGAYGFANAAGDIGPQQIELARRALNNLKNSSTEASSLQAGTAARILRGQLEDFVQYPGANVTGNAQAAQDVARLIGPLRQNAAALFRSRQLTDPLENAAMKQARGGASVGDQLGAKADQLLKTKGGQQPNTRGWIDEERNRVAQAVIPTLPEKAANVAGKAAPWLGGLIGGAGGGGGGLVAGNIPGAVGGGLVGTTVGAGVGAGIKSGLQGFSSRGMQNRWDAAAEAMRARSPAYQRAIRGSVPVAGPGQGMLPQAIQGAVPGQLTTPYDDGRAALVPSMMQQFGFY